MDEVKKLSAKKDLSLTDLYVYSNRKETEQGFAYYAFSYDGVEYTLDIYTTEQGELEGVRLVRRSDYLSIDIRNGNIDHLLTSDVSVADYLTVELPQGMAVGAYDMYMPDFGGSRIDTEETKNEEIGSLPAYGTYRRRRYRNGVVDCLFYKGGCFGYRLSGAVKERLLYKRRSAGCREKRTVCGTGFWNGVIEKISKINLA